MTDQHITRKRRIPPLYHGWLVVAAAFLFALYGFGLGFYGPGVYLAASIVDHYPNIEIPIPLQRIAYAVGIVEMIPQTTSSFEGVLVTGDAKSTGSIAYNEASGVERRRFTIAHEIGHFLIPWHGAKAQTCHRRHGGAAQEGHPKEYGGRGQSLRRRALDPRRTLHP